jgi:Cu2+-exporting ATPase
VFDKTGTLTTGRFRILRVDRAGDADERRCRAIAAGLEASSRHPLARAFQAEGTASDASANFPGLGVEGRVEGRRVRIGTEDFCRGLAPGPAPLVRYEAGLTPVFLADENAWLAVFHLEDAMRADAAEALERLRAAGLRLHLLSGDHPAAVGAVARKLGLDTWQGGATPEEKFAYLEILQRAGRRVAMVGDGLNDAPVLARADVSFAMGGGADAAQRQADVVLLGDSLSEIPQSIALAGRAMRIVRQNFGWALAYNAFALPLAATGWIGPWEAAVGMAASSFIVVLNALRVPAAGADKGSWKASSSSSRSPSPSYS